MSALLDVVTPLKFELDYAKGNRLYDRQGKAYLDTFSGIAVNALGHQHEAIVNALHTQASAHLHVSNFFRTRPQERLAQTLLDHTGMAKAFFTNSGTEATEAAIKLARKYGRQSAPSKTKIISIEGAFHGRSTGAMALSGFAHTHEAFTPLMNETIRVPREDLKALEVAFSEDVCAVVLELIYGSSGIHVLSEAFLTEIKRLAKKHQALVIVDEVQTGIFRTGSMVYVSQTPIEPDVILLAKAIGGGLPLGAMLVREPFISVLKPGDHGTTFGGNPLACALGHAVMDTVLDSTFQHHLCETMSYLQERLTRLWKTYPHYIKDLRGRGFMLGLELYEDAIPVRAQAQALGVLLNVTSKTVIRLLPSLIFTNAEVDELINVFHQIWS